MKIEAQFCLFEFSNNNPLIMNLELLGKLFHISLSKIRFFQLFFIAHLESFGQNYPEEFDGSLDCISLASTCSFNKYGTLLAVGCNDGRIVLWDFLTRGIAKIISAHVHPVCSIGWSRNGHKVIRILNSMILTDINVECNRK